MFYYTSLAFYGLIINFKKNSRLWFINYIIIIEQNTLFSNK